MGDPRIRGMVKNEKERTRPLTAEEMVMPIIWAMRIGVDGCDIVCDDGC